MKTLFLSVLTLLSQFLNTATAEQPVASISLHNPTQWDGPALVEIPTGRIGSPGSIDWDRVHLEYEGKEVPFAIREGCAHWKAALTAPVLDVRAEDLLVFSVAVPAGTWKHVNIVSGGTQPAANPVQERNGRVTVTYPGLRAAIDSASGALQELEAYGESLIAAPFSVTPFRLAESGHELKGPYGPGYCTTAMEVHKDISLPFKAKLMSQSSTPAMTELNYLLEPEEGPAMALTYRIHAMGLIEIVIDERPWTGESPWLRHAMEFRLPLNGKEEPLPYLENRWPFYGFREYTACAKNIARFHFGTASNVLELGEETVNGRKYSRRLYAFPADRRSQAADLAELADEGLVVDVKPVHTQPLRSDITNLLSTLSGGVRDGIVAEASDSLCLRFVRDTDAKGLEGDGFAITSDSPGAVTVSSRTQLGLNNAAQAIVRHSRRHGPEGGIPLIARNPIVGLRGGGFGGGDFEVDFPYGPDDEWQRAFDGLLASGMNMFACLGMWGNWKMPVGFKYMPELHSDAPDAYDESSGAKFAELDMHREHGLKLMRYLQDRGAQVWLWIPIGCVPTTFAQRYPEAMAPGSDKIPCFSSPEYRRYVDAFLREILETYPIDGFVLIRDDNGGICSCERCKEYVAQGRTKSPVWEQYLVIYDWLRTNGFSGAVGVYPYNDAYEPRLDPLLPEDLYVIGHGGGGAILSRSYERIGPMGDTWLDNLYANFRIPPSPRMRRLLSDRGSFWIGGAYCGTELPWESVGYFGWEPTATPNTLRYDWGVREFGEKGALAFLRMNDTYEHLWDINALEMPPGDWMKLSPERRTEVVKEGSDTVARFRDDLAALEGLVDIEKHTRWLTHVRLFAPYFEYHLNRLNRFASIYDAVLANREALDAPEGLPREVRDKILADYASIYALAKAYDEAMEAAVKTIPHGMLSRCRHMTKPYREWMAGYDQYLDNQLLVRQFAGEAHITTDPLRPGETFTLRVELHNQGVCPWIARAGHRIEFSGVAEKLGLPAIWEYEGEPMAPGDRRTLSFQGTVPQEPGEGEIAITFLSPFRVPEKFIACAARLEWK